MNIFLSHNIFTEYCPYFSDENQTEVCYIDNRKRNEENYV